MMDEILLRVPILNPYNSILVAMYQGFLQGFLHMDRRQSDNKLSR